LRLAVHYGCHYLKPAEIYAGFDNPEFPRSLDDLVSITGATVIDYKNKRFCCGGSILGIDENVSLKLAKTKLDSVAGADGLISICPFCSVMYEDNQKKIETRFGASYDLPVLYYPQLLGLAMELDGNELGLRLNKVKLDKLLAQCQ